MIIRVVAAELRKIATLPGTLVAVAVSLGGSLGITLLNALAVRDAVRTGQRALVAFTSPVETAFAAVPLVTVGAVILGVIAMSSEHTAEGPEAGGGRQITATFTAVPHRLTVLAVKAVAVGLLVIVTAAVTLPACLATAQVVIGGPAVTDVLGSTLARAAGAGLYWTLTALMALGLTVLTRSGLVPLIVLITNSSLVSVSILLTKITPLAYYLPDIAGMRLFTTDALGLFDGALDPLTGGLVMSAWTLGILAVAAVVLVRRDA